MARTDNLGNWASDVADTIRSKTGKTDKIPLSKFDSEIRSIKTDPILQDKSLEIKENGMFNIVADNEYDGLGNVDVIVNVKSMDSDTQSKPPVIINDYIQDGLIAWFDGTDIPNENGYWESRIGNDYIYPKYGAVTTNSSNPLPHTEDSYTNNKVYNLISIGNYLKKGYTIEVVGKLNTDGWLITMNAAGTPGIGISTVSGTEGCVTFINSDTYKTTDWSGYLGKRFGATLHLNDVPDRADSLTGTKDHRNVTKYWSGSVNGSPLKTIINAIEGFHYKAAVTPVLNYYADDNAESNRYNGEICCIRVYNRKLTDEEIAYNHEIDKILFIENDRDIAYINEGDSSIYIQEEEPESKNGIWLEKENIEDIDTYYMKYESNIYPTLVSLQTYPTATYGHGGAVVGKCIYTFGGLNPNYTKINVAYKYDIVTNKFTALATPPFYRHVPFVVAVGTDIYIIGGTGGTSPTTPESKLNWNHKYDTLTNTYTRIADLPYSAHNIKGIAIGTDIYIFGGNTSGSTNHAYKYDTLTDTYEQLTSTPYIMAGEHIVADNEYIYIFGGGKNSDGVFGLLKYNIAEDTYDFIQTDFASLSNGYVYKYGNYVYNAGGYDGINGGSSNKIYKYDLRTNTYEEIGTLVTAIANFAYGTIDNIMYILGGQTSNGASNYLQKKTLFPYDKPTAITKSNVWLYESNEQITENVPTYIGDGNKWEKIN